MTRPLTVCPVCGGCVSRSRTVYTETLRQRTINLEGDFEKCAQCGEFFFGPGEIDDVMRRTAEIVRREEGLLQPADIRALRAHLGMTQEEFEAFLGVGPKTVTRWEHGTVYQSKATDTLLRLLAEVPEAVRHLQSQRARTVMPAPTPLSDAI